MNHAVDHTLWRDARADVSARFISLMVNKIRREYIAAAAAAAAENWQSAWWANVTHCIHVGSYKDRLAWGRLYTKLLLSLRLVCHDYYTTYVC